MRLELSHYVEGDLECIADFIAQDNPERAVSFIQEIRRKLLEIHRNPHIYQLRPDIGDDARLLAFGNYVILFRVTEYEIVRIERVVYGSRNLSGIFDPF